MTSVSEASKHTDVQLVSVFSSKKLPWDLQNEKYENCLAGSLQSPFITTLFPTAANIIDLRFATKRSVVIHRQALA